MELEFKISCSGKQTQLTLTWTHIAKNSLTPKPCSVNAIVKPKGYKKKTPSDRKRDSLRKQVFIEKKRKTTFENCASNEISKDLSISQPTKHAKVTMTSTGVVTRSKARSRSSVDRNYTTTMVSSPEVGRITCGEILGDTTDFSPAHVELETNAMWSPDLDDHSSWSVPSDLPGNDQQCNESLECIKINTCGTPSMSAGGSDSDQCDSDTNNECNIEDACDAVISKLSELEKRFNDYYGNT